MLNPKTVLAIAFSLVLAGCMGDEDPPHSKEYFMAHRYEALKVIKECENIKSRKHWGRNPNCLPALEARRAIEPEDTTQIDASKK